MPPEDPYLEEALAAAEGFAAIGSRFRLDDCPLLPQGDNNRVLRGTFDGLPVIAKFFGDGYRSRTSAELRKQRELGSLRQASGTGLVPEIVAEDGCLILLQMIEGQPLDSLMRVQGSRSAQPEIATAIGAAHRVLSSLHLELSALKRIERICFAGESLEDRIDHLLEKSVEAAALDLFGDLERETIRLIGAALPELIGGPRVLYKYDNNLFGKQCLTTSRTRRRATCPAQPQTGDLRR